MPVGNLLEHLGTEPFPEFHHPLLMAGGTEMRALVGEGQKIFKVTIPALHLGKAVLHVYEPTSGDNVKASRLDHVSRAWQMPYRSMV